jgi:hypothetical protein
MPRYFFNTVDGRCYPDEDGAVLADLSAVRRKAMLVVGELLKEQPSEFWDTGRLKLEVVDEQGDTVLVIEVSVNCALAA